MPPPLAVALGPPVGAAGFASALALLLRDKPLAAAMLSPPHGLLGSMLVFFVAAADSAAGRAVLAPLLGLALVFNALFGLEAGRRGATGAVRFYTLWAALYQLGGIGFVTPALWLPAYHAAARAAATAKQPRTVTLARVRVTGAITAVVALLSFAVGVWPTDSTRWRVAAGALQFVGLLGVAYAPLRPGAASAAEARSAASAVQLLYTFLAGASTALYWPMLLRLFGGGTAGLRDLAADMGANGAARFLAVDLLGLCAAALLFVAREGRAIGVALPRAAAWSVLLSPGAAFALWCAAREARLAAGADAGAEQLPGVVLVAEPEAPPLPPLGEPEPMVRPSRVLHHQPAASHKEQQSPLSPEPRRSTRLRGKR